MLLNTLIFLATISIVIFLIKFSRKLDRECVKKEEATECKFEITEPKYKIRDNKKIATYSVLMHEKYHMFFVDFPILFKFYSEENFKTKVKIVYRVPKEPLAEEILNKEMIFAGKPKEYFYYITDIIIGRIDFEIELNVNYGNPVIGFEILPNDLCVMKKEQKIEIKFPE